MRNEHGDDGFGLTEIMISMLVLAILMMAVLALLIQALTTVSSNATRTTASERATERIEQARSTAHTGSCVNMRAVGEAVEHFEDGRGVSLRMEGSVECDQTAALEPTLATLTVIVTSDDPSVTNPVAEITSDIFVKAAVDT